MKFQDKFYDVQGVVDHNKCPSSENSTEKCILRKSYFHHSEPNYKLYLAYVREQKYISYGLFSHFMNFMLPFLVHSK